MTRKKTDFLTITPGKTYDMSAGGVLTKRKKTIRKKIKRSTGPAPSPPKSTQKKKLVVKQGHGAGIYKKGGVGCGCGGKKMQQGGVVANTGSTIEPGEFSPAQNRLFPNALPAAAASAGINSSATANQPTIPGSSSENKPIEKGAHSFGVKGFLKKLTDRRRAVGLNTSNPTSPISAENINQFGSAKSGGSSTKVDSVGQKIFMAGGSVDVDELPSR